MSNVVPHVNLEEYLNRAVINKADVFFANQTYSTAFASWYFYAVGNQIDYLVLCLAEGNEEVVLWLLFPCSIQMKCITESDGKYFSLILTSNGKSIAIEWKENTNAN